MYKFFGGVAAQYNQFRPDYLVDLLNAILKRCQHRHLYIDVACGTGQLTKQLAPHFQHSIEDDHLWKTIDKVLQSQGVLAVVSYAVIQPRDPVLLHHFNTFYYDHLGSHLPPSDPKCFWECDRRLVDNGYDGVTFPYSSSAKKESFLIHHSLSKESFFGYLRTYSALPAFYQKQSEIEEDVEKRLDPLKDLEALVGDREVIELDLRYWLLTFVKP
eukprot:gene10076-11152_t